MGLSDFLDSPCFRCLMYYFKPDQADKDQSKKHDPEEAHGIMKPENPYQKRAQRPYTGPGNISGTDRNRLLGNIQEISAQAHRDYRQQNI